GLGFWLSVGFAVGLVDAEGEVGEFEIAVVCARQRIVGDGFGAVGLMFAKQIFVDPEAEGMVFVRFGDAALGAGFLFLDVLVVHVSPRGSTKVWRARFGLPRSGRRRRGKVRWSGLLRERVRHHGGAGLGRECGCAFAVD